MAQDQDFQTLIRDRFIKLPKVVQHAIMSGDPEKLLRELSKTHQLHIDQWQSLENLVMLTLLGVYHSEDLERHIVNTIAISEEDARALTEDVTTFVFEPIREELERQLEHPGAREKEKSDVETLRESTLASQEPTSQTPPPAQKGPPTNLPASLGTPPRHVLMTKIERVPISPTYKVRESSVERKDVEGDPYRESPQ